MNEGAERLATRLLATGRSIYPEKKGAYYCMACGRKHWNHSIIGQAHELFRSSREQT